MITGITLITGLIGSGKTLRAVWYIDQEVKAGRAVYACNVNGLNIPGVIPFDDPRQWKDLPPGSLLVVDEAQRYWRARRSGEVPQELQDAETSRHDGVSMLVLTQQPTYLDKHLRGLVTRHEHLYRRMGAQATTVYAWERCVEDPNSASEKDGADQFLFVYPKNLFGAYTSAEVHTVKVKMPFRMKLVIAALTIAAGLIAFSAYRVSADPEPRQQQAGEGTVSAPAATVHSPPSTAADSVKYATVADYATAHLPRFGTMPWTAPIFDQRPVTADPQVVCMSTRAGLDALGDYVEASCTCFTEQATRYELSEGECRRIARQGPIYNPYKQARPQAPTGGVGGQPPTAMPAIAGAPSPSAARIHGAQVNGYGDIGVALNPGTAP